MGKRGVNMADVDLLIKLPEEIINEINDENYQKVISWYDTTLYCAIKDSTHLPKGHGDLIDSNVLCEQYEKTNGDLYQALDLTPSVIEADKEEELELDQRE